jgi:hypothetical protein
VVFYGLLGMPNWTYKWYKPGGKLGFLGSAISQGGSWQGWLLSVHATKLASERKNRAGIPHTEDC